MLIETACSPYWNHGWSVKSKDMPASLQLHTLIVYTGVGKSRFTVVRMEKDTQVMIITITKIDKS
jgi:hypothetical protein